MNKMDYIICPMMSKWSDGEFQEVFCTKECGFWISDASLCAVQLIARRLNSLNNIAERLENIVDNLPQGGLFSDGK